MNSIMGIESAALRAWRLGAASTTQSKSENIRDLLVFQCKIMQLPDPAIEYRFDPARQFRADLAWPAHQLLVEIEGVVFPKDAPTEHRLSGRHASVKGFEKDIEKYALATAAGFAVLRVMPKHVKSGQALQWIERALQARGFVKA